MTNGDATISLQPFSWYSKIQDIELSRSLIWTYLYKGNHHICYQHAVPGINKSYIQIYNCRSVRKSRMKLLDSSATRLHTSYDYIQESRWVRGTKTAGTVWCSGLLRCSHWTLTTKACTFLWILHFEKKGPREWIHRAERDKRFYHLNKVKVACNWSLTNSMVMRKRVRI